MPNVVLMMSDEHNPRYASPYGHRTIKTPAMARLASEGVVFENGYCPSPLCMPSRSAFVSGQRVHQLQTYSNCNLGVDPTPQSFGAALSSQGVYTAYIGKTDVYTPGHKLGFDEMRLAIDRAPPGDTNHRRNPLAIRPGADQRASGYGPRTDAGSGDRHCVDEAVSWLQSVAPQLEQPWVLIVNVTNPHFPHYAEPELWELYEGAGDLPAYGSEVASAQHPFARALQDHFQTGAFSDSDVRGLRRGYLACITFVDRQLGRLMAVLDEQKLRDDTLVIYTSDHGEMLGKFGMWWKCSLYEDAVRVPVIAAGPGLPEGGSYQTPVDLHDVQAALFEATGARAPDGWLGCPLQHIPPNDATRVVFAEYHGHGTPGSSYMVRRGAWKLIHHVGAPSQLYNLVTDNQELINLYDTEARVAQELEQELQRICDPLVENNRAERFIEAQLAALPVD
jgi:choline-sulfatase